MENFAIIDGNNWVNRAYYSLLGLTNSKGFPTGAIYGFRNMMRGMLINSNQYTKMCVCFDGKGKTHRDELYPEYKGTRLHKGKEDMYIQLNPIREMLGYFGIPFIVSEGCEADDLIYSIVTKYSDHVDQLDVFSTDKDLFQLVNGKVSIVVSKDKMYHRFGPMEVEGKLGVKPEKVRDLLALAGDGSDNVPGVRGVGEKTAVKLLREFGSVDNIIKSSHLLGEKLRLKIISSIKTIELSRELVTLKFIDSIPGIEFFNRGEVDEEKLKEFLFRYDIRT